LFSVREYCACRFDLPVPNAVVRLWTLLEQPTLLSLLCLPLYRDLWRDLPMQLAMVALERRPS